MNLHFLICLMLLARMIYNSDRTQLSNCGLRGLLKDTNFQSVAQCINHWATTSSKCMITDYCFRTLNPLKETLNLSLQCTSLCSWNNWVSNSNVILVTRGHFHKLILFITKNKKNKKTLETSTPAHLPQSGNKCSFDYSSCEGLLETS